MPDGQIVNGGVFDAQTFGKGCLFQGCTFIAPCTFDEGCIFIGCTFTKKPPPIVTPLSIIGIGATLDTCVLDWVILLGQSTLKAPTIIMAQIGPECIINVIPPAVGKAWDETYDMMRGNIISGDETSNGDWCSYRCKPGRFFQFSPGCGGASGSDGGNDWSI